jgi:hypothetical protein
MSNQKVDQPLKAGGFLTVGWGAGGTTAQSFRIDKDTDVENGFLKLYITGSYVRLDLIELEGGLTEGEIGRGSVPVPQKDHSAELWGTIRIPFVLERKREEGTKDDVMIW